MILHPTVSRWLTASFAALLLASSAAPSLFAEEEPPVKASDFAALKAEVERLRGMVPDQSHAMKDVAYHFANLWFAGQKQNWPLADFYLSETRSHLRWAVRIIPVRKTPQGQELHLADILDPLDKTVFTQLKDTIAAKDLEAFKSKYSESLNACYSCHIAVGKPFLRLQIPQVPEVPIIRFEPEP